MTKGRCFHFIEKMGDERTNRDRPFKKVPYKPWKRTTMNLVNLLSDVNSNCDFEDDLQNFPLLSVWDVIVIL